LPGTLTRRHGRIVNVSSGVGFAAIPMLSAYVVSKTALYRLSENLAAETRGVTVFAIDPGLVPRPWLVALAAGRSCRHSHGSLPTMHWHVRASWPQQAGAEWPNMRGSKIVKPRSP